MFTTRYLAGTRAGQLTGPEWENLLDPLGSRQLSGLTSTEHIIGHIGDGFLRVKWPILHQRTEGS